MTDATIKYVYFWGMGVESMAVLALENRRITKSWVLAGDPPVPPPAPAGSGAAGYLRACSVGFLVSPTAQNNIVSLLRK